MDKFLDSATGAEYMQKHSTLLPLRQGVSLYVPSGYTVSVFSFEMVERNTTPGLSYVQVMPLSGPFTHEAGLSSVCKHAIMTSNNTVLEPKATQSSMYKERLDFFKGCFSP
jgi:hypothetical protein